MGENDMRLNVRIVTLLVIAFITAGCGHYPAPIHSAWSIMFTPASEDMVLIDGLPLGSWHKLDKFRELQHFSIAQNYAEDVTDANLNALSKLTFPKLRQVSLAYAFHVTDSGLNALTNCPTIEGLQLIGLAITDHGLDTLATAFPSLKGINVEECRFLSATGFLALGKSSTIKEVGLSLGPLSQSEIERLIASLPNIMRWDIYDPNGRLSVESLRKIVSGKTTKVYIQDKNHFVSRIGELMPIP